MLKEDINLDDYTAVIAKLPEELQSRIFNPVNYSFQNFEDIVENPTGLSANLRDLLIDHQKENKLEWDKEEFEDFKILLDFLIALGKEE